MIKPLIKDLQLAKDVARLIRVTRAGTDLTLALLTNVDGRTGGKLSAAKARVLGFAEAADAAVTQRIGGTRLENAYGWSKATIHGLCSSLYGAIYPHQE